MRSAAATSAHRTKPGGARTDARRPVDATLYQARERFERVMAHLRERYRR
ncbi:hypothetical protein GCM10010129_79630 [Streptomyces fumigatiscleroticus]|nr:hypothetical protein GCM10010129_79630 [Streptomyces fumigatiscleroticus]